MHTRILSVFNLLKRVGFAVLFCGVANVCFGQDWETPIPLTNDSSFWFYYPTLCVDDSSNIHIFAVLQSDSLREHGGGIEPHVLCYMKRTNWGVPIITTRVIWDPDFPFATTSDPAVAIDRNNHLHVFWVVFGQQAVQTAYYALLGSDGSFIAGPDTLENPDHIYLSDGEPFYAVESRDGTVWAVMGNGFVGVTHDGVPINHITPLNGAEGAIWPTVAAGPDSSVWACFRWGLQSHISLRRLDDPSSAPFEVAFNVDQHGIYIDSTGARHIIVSAADSVYLLRISADGLTRDSVAFSTSGWTTTKGTILHRASGDSLVHVYETTGGGRQFALIWFSLDARVLRGPEYYSESNIGFGPSPTGLTTTRDGGYWLLGFRSLVPQTNELAMLHVPSASEPLTIGAEVPIASDISLSTFPNPFNSTLSISLDVPLHQEVTLSLYDLLGREVDVIYRWRLASQTISYVAPAALSSGVYFLRASAGERSVLTKVVLLK